MTDSSRSSRRSARAAASRPVPSIRPLRSSDFFAWIELYDQYLRLMGGEFTDSRALRFWQSIERMQDVASFVAERSGHFAGFAVASPVLDAVAGELKLEVLAIYVEEFERDGAALEALFGELHSHAASLGATALTWRAPMGDSAYTRMSSRLGALTDLGTYEMPVYR
ncbi:hypothetical protein [Gulosibacter sp. 10]|uniref:hypothetical protein n=1 Tax=Gulosibacter sp. 10 TaxID=1255570 RepID=UPI00097EF162|nr:hypothetical protein [Gulosibacter sp. 10]SJM62035.1 hypothetical protein FM112_08265 [Gulosibacter sp. 10]